MKFPLNVDVHCPDGRCGRSTHIILNPITEKVMPEASQQPGPRLRETIVAPPTSASHPKNKLWHQV